MHMKSESQTVAHNWRETTCALRPALVLVLENILLLCKTTFSSICPSKSVYMVNSCTFQTKFGKPSFGLFQPFSPVAHYIQDGKPI